MMQEIEQALEHLQRWLDMLPSDVLADFRASVKRALMNLYKRRLALGYPAHPCVAPKGIN